MVPSFEHEGPSDLLGWMIQVLFEELGFPARLGGSVTLKRRRISRGLEPDRCFWIVSAGRLQGRRRLDLRVDPPPDPAFEVDVTSSSLDRMSIYAALGVPEVWRWADDELTFNVLDGRAYRIDSHNVAFPRPTAADCSARRTLSRSSHDARPDPQSRPRLARLSEASRFLVRQTEVTVPLRTYADRQGNTTRIERGIPIGTRS